MIKKVRKGRAAFASPVTARRVPRAVSDPIANQLKRIIKGNASPEKIDRFIRNIIDKAAGGKSSTAARLLKELSKPLSVKVGESITKLVKTPGEGVTAPLDTTVPFSTLQSNRRVSGANRLYNATEHKLHFKSGLPAGQWLKSLKKMNGETTLTPVSTITTEQGALSVNRSELVEDFGFNQKLQLMINTDLFGWELQEMYSEFQLSSLDSSPVAGS